MKRFFSLFVIGGMLVIAAVVYYLNHHTEAQAKELKEKLAAARAKYAETSTPLRTSGTPEEYVRDQNEMLKKYKAELEKIAKDDPGLVNVDAEKERWKHTDEKKPPTAEQKQLREEYFNLAKATYEQLMSGAYRPPLTAHNSGARIDILSLRRVALPTGDPALRADFVAWGFPPEVAWGDINMKVWVTKETKVKGKVTKAEEIKYKFDATSARPTIAINNPDRWIAAFPPGATIGFYYLQLMPRDAEKLDLELHYKMTTESGRIVNVDVAFDKLPITEAWMLPPGAKLEAVERESSENERQGKSEDAPTAAKK